MSNIENTNTSKDRMGLVQALLVLNLGIGSIDDRKEAFNRVLEYMDEMSLLNKIGDRKDGCE